MARIECSMFLKEKIEPMSMLIDRLHDEFDYVSILGSDTKGKTLQVSRSDVSLRDFYGNECGFVVRLGKNGRLFEYSFNEWSDEDTLYQEILQMYQEDQQIQKDTGIENYDELSLNECMVYESHEQTVQKTLGEQGVENTLKVMEGMRDRIMAYDKRMISASVRLHHVHVSKAFISLNKELYQGYMYSELTIQASVRDEHGVQRDVETKSGLMGLEILDDVDDLIQKTCEDALALLDSQPMKPGTYDVICHPSVSGLIAHEAFGHGVEMDMFVKNRALAKDYMGKMVASSLVTMIDGARPKEHVASYLFDDEGNLGQETVLIKNGILQNGINDEASAVRLQVKATGNGRRESFERKAYARMTNTYFEKGTSKVADMIGSIRYGFLLEGYQSGMEDPKHWGIQCIIAKAREIVDGELTGKIFAPVILTGYVLDLLKSITMVSDEIELDGAGMCGKGYKENVKVSDGGPYLKAKARLG